jgi:hypothetical protein
LAGRFPVSAKRAGSMDLNARGSPNGAKPLSSPLISSWRGAPSSNEDRLNRFLFPENAKQITGICHSGSLPPLDHISTNPSRHSITLP